MGNNKQIMSEYFPSVRTDVLVGSKTSASVITSVALTDAYDVANKTKTVDVGSFTRVSFDIAYTVGASETSNTIHMRLDASSDGVNFFQLGNESATAGASVITQREITFVGAAAGTYKISSMMDISYKKIRVSFKESGVVTNAGSVYCEISLSGK